MSRGFNQATLLGDRLTHFFATASYSLSSQKHYDFSLRSIIQSIFVILDFVRRGCCEVIAARRGIQEFLIPKLVVEDLRVCNEILDRIFGLDEDKVDIPISLESDLINQVASSIDRFRPCLVVGACASGKSRLIRKAARRSNREILIFDPRAFAEFSWLVKPESHSSTLEPIHVFDTTVTNFWAGKIISLVDQLLLEKQPNIILETDSLDNAWGYFTSRFHIVYKHSEWNWQTALKLWLKSLKLTSKEYLDIQICFGKFMPTIVNQILITSVPFVTAFIGILRLFQCLLKEQTRFVKKHSKMEDLFLYSLIWSIGPLLDKRGRIMFEDKLTEALDDASVSFSGIDVKRNSIFNLFYDMREGIWKIPTNTSERELTQRSKYKQVSGNYTRSKC